MSVQSSPKESGVFYILLLRKLYMSEKDQTEEKYPLRTQWAATGMRLFRNYQRG